MKLSCVACRQKKIKCDRESPCSHCQKSSTPCLPQTRAKTIRKSRKTDESMLKRLKQLENIVSRLETQSNQDTPPVNVAPTDQSSSGNRLQTEPPSEYGGKLIQSNGQTKYVPTGFWMTLTHQIAEHLSEIVGEDDEADDLSDDSMATPESRHDQDKEAAPASFVLGFTSDSMTLRLLHPSAENIKELWVLYMENCKPVIKTVYVPGGTERVRRAMTDLTLLDHVDEAWMFCIYYLVTISATPQDIFRILAMDKATALDRFRWASEQSLARAGFLLSQDLLLLEAFQIYCIALSRHIDSPTVRAMISLLVNVAHSMGLHRDGEQFGLSPFDVEWRRKLWWGVRTIDLRSSLDYDAQSLLTGRWSDTKFPTNLGDEDIWPGMTETPKPRSGPTELSLTLLRWELTDSMIEIGKLGQMPDQRKSEDTESMNQRLDDLQKHLYDKYLREVSGDDFVNDTEGWVAVRVFKLLTARIWLIANSEEINVNMKNAIDNELRMKAFDKAVLALTMADDLERANPHVKWGWLFKKRMIDWQSVCIVLVELSKRFDGMDGIWSIVDRVIAKWPEKNHDLAPQLEKPLRRLYHRARNAYLRAQQANSIPRLGPIDNHGAGSDQSTVTTSPGDLNSRFEAVTELPNDNNSDLTYLAKFDSFWENDLPSSDQFDMFQTMLNIDDFPADWNTWNEP